MKIKSGYNLRKIAGENIVIMNSERGLDTTKVIALNDSSAWLWSKVVGRDFEIKEAVELLLGQYNVDEKVAKADVEHWIEQLKQNDICD